MYSLDGFKLVFDITSIHLANIKRLFVDCGAENGSRLPLRLNYVYLICHKVIIWPLSWVIRKIAFLTVVKAQKN